MPGMQFNMNPAAPTFGPGHGVGGMMYMPGGQGYFPGTFPQAAGWQGGQYGQYGMGPAAAMQAAAAAGASGSQQGMAGGAGSMGAGPQQQPGGGSGYAAAASAPKPTPTVTPPRVRPAAACPAIVPCLPCTCNTVNCCRFDQRVHCLRTLCCWPEPSHCPCSTFSGEEDPADREPGHTRGDRSVPASGLQPAGRRPASSSSSSTAAAAATQGRRQEGGSAGASGRACGSQACCPCCP